MKRNITVVLVLTFAMIAQAQYHNQRVLQKSFEQTDFFFRSNIPNPYGLGEFGGSAVGLVDDPLLYAQLNPAFLNHSLKGNHWIYLNFRNDLEKKEHQSHYFYPMYRDYIWYPRYYQQSRTVLNPIFSGAYMARVIPEKVTLGVSYQLLLSDESYYDIPQDIYKSELGYDFSGNRMSAEDKDIPIIDKYKGADEMHHRAHFFNAYANWRIHARVTLGARVGFTTFDRQGEWGKLNQEDRNIYYYQSSKHMDWQTRDQKYDHVDASGGVSVQVSSKTRLGAQIGYLSGDVDQEYTKENEFLYQHGERNTGTDWSYRDGLGSKLQTWQMDGHSSSGGVSLLSDLSDQHRLVIYGQTRQHHSDIDLASAIRDTSFYSYHNEYEYDNGYRIYDSESRYGLQDNRTGFGTQEENYYRLAVALQWQVTKSSRLSFGLNWTSLSRSVETVESVRSYRESYHVWSRKEGDELDKNEYISKTQEIKDLQWDFEASMLDFQIPVYYQQKIGDHVELVLGFNRRMRDNDIRDVTLAIYDYFYQRHNGSETEKTNFGERYTEPAEHRSEVTTTVLAGLVIKPSEMVEIRLLTSPIYRDTYEGTELDEIQWWLDFSLTP